MNLVTLSTCFPCYSQTLTLSVWLPLITDDGHDNNEMENAIDILKLETMNVPDPKPWYWVLIYFQTSFLLANVVYGTARTASSSKGIHLGGESSRSATHSSFLAPASLNNLSTSLKPGTSSVS